MADAPLISIILPSFNGADTLEASLTALSCIRTPEGGVETILIDNASTDATSGILAAHAAKLGARVLHEPRKGKSFALNRAIDSASGQLLLFLDDDVVPDEDCLVHYAAAAVRHPGTGVFAGQVRPMWQATPPDWLHHLTEIGKACACTPKHRREEAIRHTQVKGNNMLVRRAVLGDIRFDEGRLNFGQRRGRGGSEDTCFALDLVLAGQGILYVPDAAVRHMVQPHEMTVRAVFSRYVRIGRSSMTRDLYRGLPVRATTVRQVVRSLLKCATHARRRQTAAAAEKMVDAAFRIGALQALRSFRP